MLLYFMSSVIGYSFEFAVSDKLYPTAISSQFNCVRLILMYTFAANYHVALVSEIEHLIRRGL